MVEEPLGRVRDIIYPEGMSIEMRSEINGKLYEKIYRCVDPADLAECEKILLKVLRSDLHEGFKTELENFYNDLLRFNNE